jgi:hypothetical protein
LGYEAGIFKAIFWGIFRGIFGGIFGGGDIWGGGVSYLQGIYGGMHPGMPKVNLKTHFKKIMLTLSLIYHMFSVGM